MHKLLLLFFIIITQVFADYSFEDKKKKYEKLFRKSFINLTQQEDFIKVGFGVWTSNLSHEEVLQLKKNYPKRSAKRESIYLTHVEIKVDGKTYYDAYLSEFISSDPFFIFQYKFKTLPKSIELIVHNNHGDTFQTIKSLKKWNTTYKGSKRIFFKNVMHLVKDNKSKKNLNLKRYKEIWKSKSPKIAMNKLYGTTKGKPKKVKLQTSGSLESPGVRQVEHGYKIHVSMKSKENLESLAIFTEANPRSMIAFFKIPEGIKVNYGTSLKLLGLGRVSKLADGTYKMKTKGNIILFAKSRNGEFYKTTTVMHYAPCLNAGGGDVDYQEWYKNEYISQVKWK